MRIGPEISLPPLGTVAETLGGCIANDSVKGDHGNIVKFHSVTGRVGNFHGFKMIAKMKFHEICLNPCEFFFEIL